MENKNAAHRARASAAPEVAAPIAAPITRVRPEEAATGKIWKSVNCFNCSYNSNCFNCFNCLHNLLILSFPLSDTILTVADRLVMTNLTSNHWIT